MADNNTQTPVGGDATANDQPQAGMIGQYIKDLSFENPNAPASLQAMQASQPKIDVSVNVGVRTAGQDVYEVMLQMKATATTKDQEGNDLTAFIVELSYASLFGMRNIPQDQMQAFLMVQGPNLMFPFARRIIADATRDGGFQPLMLEPINFDALYRQQLAQAAEQNGQAADNPIADNISVEEAPEPSAIN